MGSIDLGIVSVMGAFNDDVDVTFSAAVGNGRYSADDDDPKLVVLRISADMGDHSASYIL